jgi:hypothetical protein
MLDIQIVYCDRCGVPCKVADTANEEARLLKHSTTHEGLCADCAATYFLQHSPMAQFLEDDINKLLAPHVQAQFGKLMQAGNADAKPEELRWKRIVANWNLPFSKPKRKRKSA